jgi:hypothetical protein
MSTPKPKPRREERHPMHLRLSPEERTQLNRAAARLGLSPSSAIRFLVNAEDRRVVSDPPVDMMTLMFSGLFSE